MATADPSYFAGTATIASTSYPAASAPSINGTAYIGAGQWSITNPDASLSIYVSFDGTNDAAIVPPSSTWTDPSTGGLAKVWMKLSAAGSVLVTGNLVARSQVAR